LNGPFGEIVANHFVPEHAANSGAGTLSSQS
jgi:hypothetical protein